jgi:hypothetical protein
MKIDNQPSTPARHALSHAISASPGVTTPCIIPYASGTDGGGGNSNGTCVRNKSRSVVGRPVMQSTYPRQYTCVLPPMKAQRNKSAPKRKHAGTLYKESKKIVSKGSCVGEKVEGDRREWRRGRNRSPRGLRLRPHKSIWQGTPAAARYDKLFITKREYTKIRKQNTNKHGQGDCSPNSLKGGMISWRTGPSGRYILHGILRTL